MGDMTNDALTEIVMTGLPYPSQISALDTRSEPNAIRFTWRGERFRVSHSLMVETVERGCLVGSDIGIVMEALFQRVRVAKLQNESKRPQEGTRDTFGA